MQPEIGSPRPKPLTGPQRYMFALLAVVYACHIIDRTIILVLLEPIKHEFNLNDSQLALLSGFIFAVGTLLAAFPIATLADRRSRKLLLAICVAAWSGMTLLCGFATGFMSLLLLRFGVGATEAGLQPTSLSLVADATTPGQRAKAVAIVHVGLSVGLIVGFVVGGWAAAHLGWRHALILVGGPGLVLAFVVALTLREPERHVATSEHPDLKLAQFFGKLWRQKPLLHVVTGGSSCCGLPRPADRHGWRRSSSAPTICRLQWSG